MDEYSSDRIKRLFEATPEISKAGTDKKNDIEDKKESKRKKITEKITNHIKSHLLFYLIFFIIIIAYAFYIYLWLVIICVVYIFDSYIKNKEINNIFIITLPIFLLFFAFIIFYLKRAMGWLFSEMDKKEVSEKINNYIYSALIISLFVVVLGFNLHAIFYGPDLPRNFYFEDNPLNLSINGYCKSYHTNYQNYPVYGDRFYCEIYLSNPTENEYFLRSVLISDYTYSTENVSNEYPKYFYERIGNNTYEKRIVFDFPIGEEGMRYSLFKIEIRDTENNPENIYSKRFYYTSINTQVYDNRERDKIATLVLILSVGIISVFSVMNNIKNLIENKTRVS